MSKIREGLPKIGGGRSRAKSVGSSIRKKESDIMLLSTPNGAEPGCFAFGNKIVVSSHAQFTLSLVLNYDVVLKCKTVSVLYWAKLKAHVLLLTYTVI